MPKNRLSRHLESRPIILLSGLEPMRISFMYLNVGRGGALVVSKPFEMFESRSSRHLWRDLGQVLNLQLPVALRREAPAQYP